MTKHELQLETKDNQLILTRKFDAPRNKVFEAHSDCKHLMKWWGPITYPITYCKIDFRVGGKWHFCLTGPDGTESWGLVIYKEIVTPELITYEDNFSDKEGNINKQFPSTTVRTEFLEDNGGTILRSVANYASAADLKTVLDMGMAAGITETLDKLEEFLAG
jgi:uncharacterized protein YndB with AHSA1/START domain